VDYHADISGGSRIYTRWVGQGRGAEVERHSNEDRGAAGAEGDGVWGGGVGGVWRGAMFPPQKHFSILDLKLANLGAFWALFLQFGWFMQQTRRTVWRGDGGAWPPNPLNPSVAVIGGQDPRDLSPPPLAYSPVLLRYGTSTTKCIHRAARTSRWDW